MVLGVVRPEKGAWILVPLLMRGLPMNNSRTGLGPLKIVWIVCWTKMVHDKFFACYCLVVE